MRTRRGSRRLAVSSIAVCVAAVCAALASPREACAQTAEIAAARETLIQQAQEARTRGDHRAALRAAMGARARQ
jgi:hypothetical protein